jgi:outer membrane protein OmpA-like peptidoglycan-associated protein
MPVLLGAIAFLVASGVAGTAVAQTGGNVELHQYQPSPFSDRVLRLDGASVLPFGQFRLGVDADYGFKPLVLSDAAPAIIQGNGGPYAVVRHAVGATLTASFGLSHRLEAGLAIPLMLFQTGDDVAGAVKPGIAGVGNVRLGLKVNILKWRGLGLGASVVGAIPAGVGALTHEGGIGGEARLFARYSGGPLTAGVRAGFRLRAQQNFYDVPLGNELTVAAGATFALLPRTAVLAELAGATAVSSPFANPQQSPLEVLVGARQRIGKTWLTLAAGPGLVEGYGSPLFRAVAAFTWANVPPDADSDGIPDDDDACPEIPEDKDGFEDRDGCPDPDNDKDGILDAADKCPDKPETVNEFEDDDGCPDEAPPKDNDKDKDGILDDVDDCPEEAEDKDGFEDDDGCPDPDNDKDGILDAADKCPLEPETINGVEDDDGCPDKGQSQVRLKAHEIETLQPIYFDTDRSRVRHAFHNVLGQIALLLKAHPEIGRCAVEGHTDDTGPVEWNQKLSMLRAESVIEFLTSRGGVDPKRLVPIGHGEKTPWTSNETPWGRAKNRRVVFHIEGVSAEELQKQELRRERRRIRREREREERERARSSKDAAPKEKEAATDAKEPPAKHEAPAQHEAKPTEAKPAEAKPEAKPEKGAKPEAKPETKTETRAEPKADPKSDKHETPDKHETKPVVSPPAKPGPSLPEKPGASKPPAAQEKAAKEKPQEDEEEEEAPAKSDKADKSGQRPTKPARPAKRAPDAGAGPPPTLRDLLKLPPR